MGGPYSKKGVTWVKVVLMDLKVVLMEVTVHQHGSSMVKLGLQWYLDHLEVGQQGLMLVHVGQCG